MNTAIDATATHYPTHEETEETHRYIITMIARDRTGTMSRVVNLFSARDYNIDSVSASNIDPIRGLSSITLTTIATEKAIDQIIKQLERLVDIQGVTNVSNSKDRVIREMVLVKVKATGQERLEAVTLANGFQAKIIDAAQDSIIIEMSGAPQKVNAFIEVMRPLGLIDVVKSGPAGMVNSPKSKLQELMD